MIDLLDPAMHASGTIDRALDELRARAPVAWSPGRRGPGYWSVTGYDELVTVARDPDTFSSWWGTRPEVRRAEGAPRPLHNLDPPAHTPLRRLAQGLLAPARIALLAPVIERVVDAAILPFVAAGGGDAIAAIAVPVTARVLATWLGLPDADAPHLATRVEAVHGAGAALLEAIADRDRQLAAHAATTTLATWLRGPLERGDATPGSVLHELAAHADRDEATMLAALLVEAGLPTTSDALGCALAAITERPRDVGAAVDEVLAGAAPVQQFARRATREVELAGVRVRAGDQLVLWYGAANRDPRRGDRPHLSFGAGPHRCVGALLARDLVRALLVRWFVHVERHTARGERRASSYLRGYAWLDVRPVPPPW